MRLSRRSRRGAHLAAAATVHVVIGFAYLTTPTQSRNATFSWLPAWFGMKEIGLFLMACGIAIVCLALGWPKLPAWSEDVAFGLLAMLPLSLLFVFVGAMIANVASTAWISVVIFSSYAATVWTVSGWPNPPTRRDAEAPGDA